MSDEFQIKAKKFGSNLKRMRMACGISQAELARACKLTSAAVSQIESGKRTPSLTTVFKILKVVPTTLEALVK